MYCIRKVNDDYTWVGADCRRLALFEGVFGVPDGVSFNSYLLMDDKTVLFDTVDSAVRTTFRENVAHVLNGRAPDYLVVHHMEPDHAAEMADLARQYPDMGILCSRPHPAPGPAAADGDAFDGSGVCAGGGMGISTVCTGYRSGGAAAICAALRCPGGNFLLAGAGAAFSAYLAVLAGRGSIYGASFMAAGADALTFLQKSMDFSGKSHCLFQKIL